VGLVCRCRIGPLHFLARRLAVAAAGTADSYEITKIIYLFFYHVMPVVQSKAQYCHGKLSVCLFICLDSRENVIFVEHICSHYGMVSCSVCYAVTVFLS